MNCVCRLVCLVWLALASAAGAEALEIENRLRADVSLLAGDSLEGRGLDTEGIRKAADHIRGVFQKAGLRSATKDGTYFQPFKIRTDSRNVPEKTSLVLKSPDGKQRVLQLGKDYQAITFGGTGEFEAPVVFVGYGIVADKLGYDDYKGIDVTGKVVIVMRREPQQGKADSVFDGTRDSVYASMSSKIENASFKKAAAVLLVSDPFTVSRPENDTLVPANYIPMESPVAIPTAQIRQELVSEMLAATGLKDLKSAEQAIDSDLKPRSQLAAGWTAKGSFAFETVRIDATNVAGQIDGDGPLAKEVVIVGGHYDHLGYGGSGSLAPNVRAIHNGADDNASGSAVVLELARRFGARPKKLPRSLLFMTFSGEERGLLGSRHYVRRDPLVPLENTVAMVNFDMVGRLNPETQTLILFGVQSAREFDPIVDRLNQQAKFKLKKSTGLSEGFGGSDHQSFYDASLPVFHFFTGVHPDYHRPSDDVEKINFEGMKRIADMAEKLIEEIASLPQRPTFVKLSLPDPHAGVAKVGKGQGAYLGTIPDYSGEAEGAMLSGVNAGSPAEKGGLKGGDIITDIDGTPIRNVSGFALALRRHKPGDVVAITVKRGAETLVLKVTLGTR